MLVLVGKAKAKAKAHAGRTNDRERTLIIVALIGVPSGQQHQLFQDGHAHLPETHVHHHQQEKAEGLRANPHGQRAADYWHGALVFAHRVIQQVSSLFLLPLVMLVPLIRFFSYSYYITNSCRQKLGQSTVKLESIPHFIYRHMRAFVQETFSDSVSSPIDTCYPLEKSPDFTIVPCPL